MFVLTVSLNQEVQNFLNQVPKLKQGSLKCGGTKPEPNFNFGKFLKISILFVPSLHDIDWLPMIVP